MTKYSTIALSAALLSPFASVSAWTNSHSNLIQTGNMNSIAGRRSVSYQQLNARPSSFATADTDALLNKITSTEKATEQAISNVEQSITNVEKTSASSLLDVFNSIDNFFSSFTSQIFNSDGNSDGSNFQSVLDKLSSDQLSSIIQQSIDSVVQNTKSIDDLILSNPTFGPFLSSLQDKILSSLPSSISTQITTELSNVPASAAILASAVITYTIASTVLSLGEGPPPSTPYPLGRYDARSARAYFDNRLNEVIARGIEIGSQSLVFGLSLLSDKLK